MNKTHFRLGLAALLFAGCAAAPAHAQDSEADADATANSSNPEAKPTSGPLSISGSAIGVTDYRFRGITQSDEDPAAQATATVTHESGLYAGVWGSTLKGLGNYGNSEIDLYVGYGTELAPGTSFDAGLLYYVYPDGIGNTDYAEPYASISHTLGPVAAKVGVSYAFEGQSGLGNEDNLYVFGDLSASVPLTPFTLKAHLGYSDGSLAAYDDGDYVDYALGVEAAFGPARVGVSYLNTDIRKGRGLRDAAGADGTLVGTVSFSF